MPSYFESWNSYWAFSQAVRFRSRFLHDDVVKAFLQAITDSTEKRSVVLTPGKVVCRAQLGHDWRKRNQAGISWDEPIPFSAERMKPLRNSALEGRVNPRGIPCLYAANNEKTAIAEVRPWVGALVSVAQMRPVHELRLVDCSDGHEATFDLHIEEPPPEIREGVVWREIGRAFSSPVSTNPGIAEYVPTQILAEHFRKQGYDGVHYKSKLGPGYNIAVFDLAALEVVKLGLFPIESVDYKIGEEQDSYFIRHPHQPGK